ncbi:unnamed protein product [Onchocerca flexuosa]|uniref:DUF3127 domain-containing protein n=1 Tax=Onchocerca flexuosa TaxID=387005 RepID=A0A183HZ65_9BILA|nr:unnamed protein product [Onchocerca flexuosa]
MSNIVSKTACESLLPKICRSRNKCCNYLTTTLSGEAFEVGGRGEQQLVVLTENMRRESFELSISSPRVFFKEGLKKLEPIEEVIINVDDEYSGTTWKNLASVKVKITPELI